MKDKILKRVKELKSFKHIPSDYWLCGIRSKGDKPNEFDDKIYLFRGTELILATTGTTNPGIPALKNFDKVNKLGAAVVKSDEWYYDLWSPGLHKGKMRALRQVKPILFYRDNNRNDKSEEVGTLYKDYIGINFHTSSYNTNHAIYKSIGEWSYGCQVCNNIKDYYTIIDKTKHQKAISYVLLKEF